MLCSRKSAVMTTSVASMDKQPDNEDSASVAIEGMRGGDHVTMLMSRGRAGYGFTVTGACPVRVGRVEEGSTSDQAGLERGDYIIRINGQNVTRMDMSTVAALVKQCDRQMVIDVHRYDAVPVEFEPTVKTYSQGVSTVSDEHVVEIVHHKIGSSESGKSSGFSSWNDDIVSDSESDATSYSCDAMPPALAPWKRVPHADPWMLYHQLKKNQAHVMNQCDSCESDTDYSYFTDTESCFSCSTYNLNKENLPHSKMMRFSNSPPQSDVSTQNNNNYLKESQPKKRGLSYRETKDPNMSKDSDVPAIPPRKPPPKTKAEKAVPPVPKDIGRATISIQNNNDSQLSEDSGLEMASQLPVSYHGLSEAEVQKQKVIDQLFESEVRFRDSMRYGMTQFYEPLRNNVVTREQHNTLFQNVVQLCKLSEELVSTMRANLVAYSDVINQKRHLDNIGAVLTAKIDEMCIEYERYCSGVRDSLTLYMSLRKIREFDQYITDLTQDGRLKISSFIQKPVEHVKNLTLTVQRIYKLTDTNHHDYDSLQEVVRALRRCSGNISQEYIRQSQSNLASVTSKSTTTLSQASNPSVTSSVDSEVQDIQNRLIFAENSKTFQLTNTSRHVIYMGDLQYDSDSKWMKVHAILMNDVLLLTQREEDNFLTVLDTPILLHDVRACRPAPSRHPAEFELKIECHHCQPLGFEPKYYAFRAASLEQKCVWKNLIEQRVALMKTQKHLTSARVELL